MSINQEHILGRWLNVRSWRFVGPLLFFSAIFYKMTTATVEHPTSTTASVDDPTSLPDPTLSERLLIDEQICSYMPGSEPDDFPGRLYGSPRLCESDINEEIDLTLDYLENHFLPENIKLVKDLGPLPRLETFPRLLNQVWTNLVINAAQSIGASAGEVTVQTRLVNNMVRVSISDNGPGIPPECMHRIFEPFFTTKNMRDANGLGLSVSADIIRRHRGQINVINWPGEGVRFIVLIPVR